MNENNRALFGILAIVVLFFTLLLTFAFLTMKTLGENTELDLSSDEESGKIVVVEVEGVILKSKKTIELLRKAEKVTDAKALIVRVNSPGGAVGPTQEIYEELIRIDEKLPVYASFGSIAASGGYYIGAAARKIFTNKGTLTGSIGVIMQFADLSKLYKLARINPQTIKAGKYKDIGQPTRALTAEEKRLMDDLIAGVHDQFMEDITRRREKKLKKDIRKLAQGQIYSGLQAKELGLVDEIGGLWAAGRKIHEELKLSGEFTGFKFIKKKKKLSFWEIAERLDETLTDIKSAIENVSQGPQLFFK